MKKWTYLVATLFFGATVAFTSCVNTDEPEGIKEMRGAKAELLRAKALVAQAEATAKAAEATLTQAQAEVQKAIAEVQKAQAEAQRAQTQIEKDKAAVELQKLQAEAEAKIAEYEANAAKQQLAYEKTMRELEALALTLTKEEQNAITSWKTFADNANRKLQTAEGTLKTAQEGYYNAVTNKSYISESVQEAKVAKAQLEADQKAKAYAIQEEVLASLKETAPAEWDEVLRDLKDSIYAAEVAVQEAKVAKKEYYRSEEFQAYEQAVLAAIEAKGENKGVPGQFNNDGTYTKAAKGDQKTQWTGARAAYDAAAVEFNKVAGTKQPLEAYSHSVNPAVAYFLEKAGQTSLMTVGYGAGEWDFAGYQATIDLMEQGATGFAWDNMYYVLDLLAKQRKGLDEFEIDPNGQEWLKLELPAKKKASLKADSIYDAAVALWQIQADIVAKGDYSGVAIADSAKALKELIDGQNAAYKAYAAGVAAYDSMVYVVEKAAKAAYNAGVEKQVAKDEADWKEQEFLKVAYNLLPTNKQADDWKLGKIFYTQENWVAETFPKGGTGKDTVTMKIILGINHEVDPGKMPTTVDAVKTLVEQNYSKVFTAKAKEEWMKATKSLIDEDAKIGLKELTVGNWEKYGNDSITKAMANTKSDLAKAIAETKKKRKLISDEAVDGSLLKAYLDYDGNVIKSEFNNFSKALLKTYGLNTVDTLSDADKFNTLVGYDQYVAATGGNSYKYVKNVQGGDSIVTVDGVRSYRILEAVKKSISDEAFATMKEIAKINDTEAKSCLTKYSHAAFGSNYDWETSAKKARLINEIEEKLLADCQAIVPITDANESAFEAACGAFGKKYWNNYWFEVCSNYQQADELKQASVDSLDAQIAVLQAAVETAKTACAEPLAALDSAKADYEAAEAAIEAAEDERDAQMTAQEALVTLAEAVVAEWKYQEANLAGAIKNVACEQINQYVSKLYPSVEAYLNDKETKLATAKINLEEANEAVVEAQKVLDMIKAGTYSYEFGVQQAESALERAQANYDIAAAEYQAALAKLAEVLATLVGE